MTSRVPDLDGLHLLVAVATEGSIGGAARSLGVAQQSASERLRAVEAQVGLPLVRRTPRGSVLTEPGTVVVEWARRLLDLADEIDHAIDGLRGDRERGLAVWASLTVAETLLPQWLVRLRQRQAAEGLTPTTVSLTATNSDAVLRAVRREQADLGFVEGAEPPGDLPSRVVARDELVLVAAGGTPWSRRRTPVGPAEVAAATLTVRERGSGTREVLERALATHGLALASGVVEMSTGAAVRGAVVAGGPPAFLSRRVVGHELAAGTLVRVPTTGLDLARSLRAVWLAGVHPPAGAVRDLVGLARGPGTS